MKLLLLSFFCVSSSMLFAEQNNIDSLLKKYDGTRPLRFEMGLADSIPQKFQNFFRSQEYQLNLSTNESRIVILPQDRMPSIVPNTSGIAPIPNAWTNVQVPYVPQHHPIPNPGLKPQSFNWSVTDYWKTLPKK